MRMMMRSVESGIHEAILARPLPVPKSQKQAEGWVLDIDPPRQHYLAALQAFATASWWWGAPLARVGLVEVPLLGSGYTSLTLPGAACSCFRWLQTTMTPMSEVEGGKGIDTSSLKDERASKRRPVILEENPQIFRQKTAPGPSSILSDDQPSISSGVKPLRPQMTSIFLILQSPCFLLSKTRARASRNQNKLPSKGQQD